MWSLNFTLILEPCRDTDAGHTDQDGDGCNAYSNPGACGDYDLGDFEANAMCCICGEGSNIGKYQVNICVNIIVIDTYNKVYIKEYKENKVKKSKPPILYSSPMLQRTNSCLNGNYCTISVFISGWLWIQWYLKWKVFLQKQKWKKFSLL